MIYRAHVDTPQGPHLVYTRSGRVVRIVLPGGDADREEQALAQAYRDEIEDGADDTTRSAVAQLQAYYRGERSGFDLPLEAHGTDFQRAVWGALERIPYGQTRSYADIAAAIGRPGAARAVGQANRRNPLPIVVPCHRVVAADGGLGGYMGGIADDGGLKARLLALEQKA